jgi:hypothetical protein
MATEEFRNDVTKTDACYGFLLWNCRTGPNIATKPPNLFVRRAHLRSLCADSAVEPTKSENITVTWRRSAESWGFGSISGAAGQRQQAR